MTHPWTGFRSIVSNQEENVFSQRSSKRSKGQRTGRRCKKNKVKAESPKNKITERFKNTLCYGVWTVSNVKLELSTWWRTSSFPSFWYYVSIQLHIPYVRDSVRHLMKKQNSLTISKSSLVPLLHILYYIMYFFLDVCICPSLKSPDYSFLTSFINCYGFIPLHIALCSWKDFLHLIIL